MPVKIIQDQKVIKVSGKLGIDEVEDFFEILQKDSFKVDLSECSHLHTAAIQALILSNTEVICFPKENNLASLLKSLF